MTTSTQLQQNEILDRHLNESRRSAFLREILTNSGHFLILNSLAEMALMSWQDYLSEPAHYLIIAASCIQAWYLSRPQCHRFWGNFIGAALYTITDLPIDGWGFFREPNHLILIGFALIIAVLQGLRYHWAKWASNLIIPLESVTRMGMLLTLYEIVALKGSSNNKLILWGTTPQQAFLIESLLIVSLLVGLQTLQVHKQQEKLQTIAQQLRHLAEWGMGSYAVTTAVTNPQKLSFQRCDRTIVFMDIRGFTQWCEKQSPDEVAQVLNVYYQKVEPAATQYNPLRVTLTADEVMAIYEDPHNAVKAASAMQQSAQELLIAYNLGAGCGIHSGSVIEGLFGSEEVRTYTAIGDVVNVAKRLESSTPAGKITLSDAVYQALSPHIAVIPRQPIIAKGKSQPIHAWYLQK